MPTQPIPFGVRQESGLSQLGGGSPAMMNVVMDSRGVMTRRPGIRAYSGAPAGVIDSSGISGLYVPANGNLYAVGNDGATKHIYRVTAATAADLTVSAGALGGLGRPIFAETEAMLAIAGGAHIKKLLLASDGVADLSADAPIASHVIANNNRLLANSIGQYENQVYFSGQSAGSSTSGNEQWVGGISGYFSSDARPDPCNALWENSREVYVWGPSCVQIFVQDATINYAATITREFGCMAPYSVVKLDDGFAWLDNKRRLVLGSGRDVAPISDAIQDDLDTIDVTGCYGYRVFLGACDVIVWTFPASSRTYAYSTETGWSQWSGWSSATSSWQAFRVLSFFQRPDDGACLVGLTDGRVCELTSAVTTDLGDPINASATTGFLDRDNSKLKCTTAVRLLLNRGTTSGSDTPVAHLSWRDDLGDFCSPLPVDLGATGDRSVVVQFRSLGTYRTRQWKLQFAGSEHFELVSAEEDFTVQGV